MQKVQSTETIGNDIDVLDIVLPENKLQTAGNCVEHDSDVDNIEIQEEVGVMAQNKAEHESDDGNQDKQVEDPDVDDIQLEGLLTYMDSDAGDIKEIKS